MGVQCDVGTAAAYDARTADDDSFRRPGNDGDLAHIGVGHPRGPERIDEEVKLEFVLDERLYARARASESAVSEPDLNDVTGAQVSIDGVDEKRLLERPLAALDVVAGIQTLHAGRAGFRSPANQ